MKINIKNMVCNRCKMIVAQELQKIGLNYTSIDLGEIELDAATKDQLILLDLNLRVAGLEIIECKTMLLVEQIKICIVVKILNDEENISVGFSQFISKQLKHDHLYLNRLFLNQEGISIHQYIKAQKIERVKELLLSRELNLSQIAYKLNYSSVAHLSSQFKKVTGFTPSNFLNLKRKPRCALDQVGLFYRKNQGLLK
jgi:AraC-like DNA-binding protein